MLSPQRWVKNRLAADDAGFTLMEVMVGMVMMTIFMGIFTSSIVSMFSASNKVQAIENSSGQLDTAFDRLDKQIRYASVIGPVSSAPYPSVTFLTPGLTPGSTQTCTQLAIPPQPAGNPLELTERSWQKGFPPGSTWSQLALGISLTAQNGSTVTPFAVTAPTGTSLQHQQLQLQLVTQDGAGQSRTLSTSSFTFTALNSTAALLTTNPNPCPATPVAAP